MNRTLFTVLIILFFMNIGDAFATYYWIVYELAEELNPIALYLLNISPTLFLVYKCLLGSVCLFFIWMARRQYKNISLGVAYSWLGIHFIVYIFHIRLLIVYANNS